MSGVAPEAAAAPEVTVIIPVHGDRGGLGLTLDCLDRQDFPGSWDVVLVDNGDNRSLPDHAVGRPRVRVVGEAAPGSYVSRNTGVASSAGEVLAFTDGDCLPRPGWLAAGVRALRAAGPDSFVGGRIVVDPGAHPSGAALWDSLNGLRQDVYIGQGWAATANLFVARDTFARVGEFAAGMQSSGDREWGTRASAAGVRGLFDPDACIEHPARESMGELTRKIRRVNAGTLDYRRRRGLPAFEPGEFGRTARPWLRSSVRTSATLASPLDRARYVATASALQYYGLGHRVALQLTRSRRSR